MLGVGGAKKTYLDDVFSTSLYTGQGSTTQTITNSIDLSGKGGMVWTKGRSTSKDHMIIDTVRGANKRIFSNENSAENTASSYIQAFNNNGYSVGSDDNLNGNNVTFASFSFRKAPGFFDIVSYSGNDTTNRQISHNLGANVGMVMVKNLGSTDDWAVWCKDIPAQGYLRLNTNDVIVEHNSLWGSSPARTSTYFTVGTAGLTNASGNDYIAYVFAGADPVGYGSVSMTSNSVGATGNRVKTDRHSDFAFGSDPFTIECWFKSGGTTNTYNTLLTTRTSHSNNDGSGWSWLLDGDNINLYAGGSTGWVFTNEDIDATDGNWHHVAVVREGTGTNQTKLYHNGTLKQSATVSGSFTNDILGIGDTTTTQHEPFWGHISNVRTVKNQALYTSNFTPSTTPLTLTSQGATAGKVGIVGCNDVAIEKFTKSSGGLFAYGNAAGSAVSPFTAPADYNASRIFGENKDQDIIKCGQYTGSGSTGFEVNVGFEPQWVMLKNTSASNNWYILDSMRGWVASSLNDQFLCGDLAQAESNYDFGSLTPRGFKLSGSNAANNADGNNYSYIAIRRQDAFAGKPASAGTDVFAMDVGNSSSTIPCFDSGFPVDLALLRQPTTAGSWYVAGRLISQRYLFTDTNAQEADGTNFTFDSNVGWSKNPNNTDWQSWMFKRHAGFDMVTYEGTGTAGHQIPHSLSKTPEMMWVKRRDGSSDWMVYHNNLNGGTTPHNWFMKLNSTGVESENSNRFGGAPSSSHFIVGTDGDTNQNNATYLAILFASTAVSKVGYYTGTGSSRSISFGFQPRFMITKRIDSSVYNWYVLDTTHTWGSGTDQFLHLDTNGAQSDSADFGTPTSTGIDIIDGDGHMNASGGKYIYYAHA